MPASKIIIKKFRPSDADSASRMICKAQRITLAMAYPKSVIDFFCSKNSPDYLRKVSREYSLFVAVANGKVVGIIGRKGNELKKFFVDPSFQGRGIGRKLYEHLQSLCKRKMCVHSSLLAQPVYERFGFRTLRKVIARVRGRIKYDYILMSQK